MIDKGNADPRFEVELPISMKDRGAHGDGGRWRAAEFSRRMTALVIEPDEAAQRQILALLSTRGFRVVPVAAPITAWNWRSACGSTLHSARSTPMALIGWN